MRGQVETNQPTTKDLLCVCVLKLEMPPPISLLESRSPDSWMAFCAVLPHCTTQDWQDGCGRPPGASAEGIDPPGSVVTLHLSTGGISGRRRRRRRWEDAMETMDNNNTRPSHLSSWSSYLPASSWVCQEECIKPRYQADLWSFTLCFVPWTVGVLAGCWSPLLSTIQLFQPFR